MKSIYFMWLQYLIIIFVSLFVNVSIFFFLTTDRVIQCDFDQIIYASSVSNDFDEIIFQELLRIFNALCACKDKNNIFSKRSDYDAYFWISLNEFNLIKRRELNEKIWINSIKISDEIKNWKFKMSFTHLAFLRNLLSSTRDNTSRKRDVSKIDN